MYNVKAFFMSQDRGNRRKEENINNNRDQKTGQPSKPSYFEGMNYEQPRQPYHPRTDHASRPRSAKDPGSSDHHSNS
jgi:hypothetical protein